MPANDSSENNQIIQVSSAGEQINAKNSLDLYGKYFYTHQCGDDVTLVGDKFEFDDINSHRTRLGARYSYAITEYAKPYVGAAWEHEFGGDAEYSVHNFTAGKPSLKGSTGMFEIGMSVKADNIPLSFNFGFEGYTGVREGISANMSLRLEF